MKKLYPGVTLCWKSKWNLEKFKNSENVEMERGKMLKYCKIQKCWKSRKMINYAEALEKWINMFKTKPRKIVEQSKTVEKHWSNIE